MSVNGNIWYLDRGKNFFTEEGKDLFQTIISVLNTYRNIDHISSGELISKFPKKYRDSGNPNALLTTARNIGILNKDNELGENIEYYLNDKLTYKELIFENLTKINYDKDSTKPVKPFIVICKALIRLYYLDKKEAYLTKADCINYLYAIDDYFKINNELAKEIIDNRSFSSESAAVLDIWFNALQNFDIFTKTNDSNIIRLNEQEISFFDFIDKNGGKIPCYLNGESRYGSVYTDLGKIDMGINAIIPEININTENIEIEEIYNYLFGIENYENPSFDKSFQGIYKPFRTIPNIAIRKVEKVNKQLAEKLFNYNQKVFINKE